MKTYVPAGRRTKTPLWNVTCYAVALTNCYGIDLEEIIRKKEELNRMIFQCAPE